MTDANEKIFKKTRANLYKYDFDSPEYNTAKETMRNLADSGYIPAFSFVISGYKNMGVDPDIYLSILQDLNDDSGEYYAELAKSYSIIGKEIAASAAAEKSVERGCLTSLHYCNDWERLFDLLDRLNPADYSIEKVSAVASACINHNDIHNNWMDYSLEYIEKDLSKGQLHISEAYLLRGTKCEGYHARLKRIYESTLELAREQKVKCDD